MILKGDIDAVYRLARLEHGKTESAAQRVFSQASRSSYEATVDPDKQATRRVTPP